MKVVLWFVKNCKSTLQVRKIQVIDFEDATSVAIDVNVDSASIIPQKKQSGNENNEKEYHQVISYGEDEVNKSKDINASKQK